METSNDWTLQMGEGRKTAINRGAMLVFVDVYKVLPFVWQKSYLHYPIWEFRWVGSIFEVFNLNGKEETK